MKIVIYESSSKGGCFDYAKEIFKTYCGHDEVKECTLLLPAQTLTIEGSKVLKILLNDTKDFRLTLFNKIYFLFRAFVNPFLLLFFLINKKSSLVILNDFEQISSIIWVPFYKLLIKKHTFAVVLHDPDRDQYPPSKVFSEISMKCMMSLIDFAIYHESIPDKEYYKCSETIYINVPHGIYQPSLPDLTFKEELKNAIGSDFKTLAIIGNIRKEKNYELAIKSLKYFPFLKLIIAGKQSNQDIDISKYKNLAENLDVNNRIVWIEKYLSDSEMATVINFTDIILLNYARSFKSQSGILNLLAPYKKKVIVSNGESSLAHVVQKFKIGTLIEPDNLNALLEGISRTFKSDFTENWVKYLDYASWVNNIQTVIEAYKFNKLQS